ncbi:hypothetical protein LRH25_14410 [Ideonella azotifigens]|uniref:Uncharacterized protein n=1 Tax=Ideonella azotifigens TaxID=513160 RepID=A0ABN1KMM9_9BURK|nr:hypothetical protein [Ideonella azotifigens]MCD2341533.1 hypothetical protein [Ideonella azotifigens]
MSTTSPRLLWALAFLGTATAATATPDLDALIATTHSKCGYEVSAIRQHIQNGRSESVGTAGLKIDYAVGWQQGGKRIEGALTFNCGGASALPPDPTAPVASPKELIAEEDAGGRYSRHVAWQKPVKAAHWSPQVAYVDYSFGDGQRTRSNDFLICDGQVAIPCISLSITKPEKLSADEMASVLSKIASIDALR